MESLLIYEGIFSRTPTSQAQSFSNQDQVGGDLFNHSATKTKWQGNLFF